ncbi:MAG: twin-arginine translocase TatA/TatE family subunit [Chlorobi bacterium]|nr:twin-arginine translocase TatA/TatE family subunit [Chlorobiota bacterium]MBX7216333.1 twin-arginine translocase TatA/TatE family subunit [Candidatus Kapabacteria bacterium]
MMGLGSTEIIVIVLIILILFGGKKIPELMRGLGSGVKEFKKATNGDDESDRRIEDRRYDDQRRLEDRRYDDQRQPAADRQYEERRP